MRVLIVRLGALGDIVHTLPLAAALRTGVSDLQLDWVVDERHKAVLDLASSVDDVVVLRSRTLTPLRAMIDVIRRLRERRYGVALDAQGLLKSALVARGSGARRVVGFSAGHLRERAAGVFYGERQDPGDTRHVVARNLSLAKALDVEPGAWEFLLDEAPSPALVDIRRRLSWGSGGRFVLLNPGGGWPNKRWPAEHFGELAFRLSQERSLPSIVAWGPGDESLAQDVVERSGGAATLAPPASIADLVAILRAATLVVSGDTGPLHLAAAVRTPVVGLYGPTDPQRNGPWSPEDVVVSRYASCQCRFARRCTNREWCLETLTVDEVIRAVERRLG